MELESSPMWREVERIKVSGENPVHFTLAANVHLIKSGVTLTALKVIQRDDRRDFENDITAVTIVKLLLLRGDYAVDLYPGQDQMEITLVRYPLAEVGDAGNPTAKIRVGRYKATLLDQGSPNIEMPGQLAIDKETMNRLEPLEIEFQLLPMNYLKLRTIQCGGTHRACLPGDVVLHELTRISATLDVDETQRIHGVKMVPSINQTPREHVVIPQGTTLTDLPAYVHKYCGGLYANGLGYFLQDNYWYVYPCYDTKRWTSGDESLTVLNVPNDRLLEIERTYRQNGRNLIILATDGAKLRDSSGVTQMNEGNGVRFVSADKLLAGFTTTSDNKTVAQRINVASELIAIPRDDGQNIAPMSKNAITSNSLYELSQVAGRRGAMYCAVWENSNPELIKPGMPATIRYIAGSVLKELTGVVVKAEDFTYLAGVGLTTARHKSRTMITIYVLGERG